MPTLYPENTQYSPQESTASIGKALSSGSNLYKKQLPQGLSTKREIPSQIGTNSEYIRQLIAQLQQKLIARQSGQTQQAMTPEEIASGSSSLGSKVHEQQNVDYPLNEPFVQPKDRKSTPIPKQDTAGQEYQTWKADEQGRWVIPTETARISTIPKFLGGGQYISDPSQPGKLIKSERSALTDPNKFAALPPNEQANIAQMKLMMTGGNKNIQIDHITPLWAGGVDTLENLQPIRHDQHTIKTKIQAVPFTLLTNGIISKDQAKIMAQGWQDIAKNYNVDSVPNPFLKSDPKTGEMSGELDLNVAKKFADEWSKPKEQSFMDYLKGIPESRKVIGKSIAEQADKLPPFWANMQKGFVQEASMGVIPTMEKPPETFAGTLGYGLGSGLGFMIPFSAATKIVKGIGVATGLFKGATGVVKGAEKLAEVKKLIGGGSVIERPGYRVMSQPYKGTGKILIERKDKIGETLAKNMVKNAVGMAAYGQLRTTMPTMFGDPDPGLAERTKQFIFDTAYGGGLGFFSKSLPQTFGLGAAVWSASMAEQYLAEGEPDASEAIANALTMMMLHKIPTEIAKAKTKWYLPSGEHGFVGTGQSERSLTEMQKSIKSLADDQNKLSDILVTEMRSKILSNKPGEHNPYLTYAKKGEAFPLEMRDPIKLKEDSDRMKQLIAEEGKNEMLSPSEMKLHSDMIDMSERQLIKGGESEIVKQKMNKDDIVTLFKKTKDRYQTYNYRDPDIIGKTIDRVPDNIKNETFFPSFDAKIEYNPKTDMRVWISGSPKEKENMDSYISGLDSKDINNGIASHQVIIVSVPEVERFQRMKNNSITKEEIANKKHLPDENPWYNEQVYGVVKMKKDGKDIIQYIPLGWIGKPSRMEGVENSVNEQMRKNNFPEYDLNHNANTLGELKGKLGIKISTGRINSYKSGAETESKRPYVELVIKEEDSIRGKDWKQYYEEPTGVSKAKQGVHSTVPEGQVISDANNIPNKENATRLVNAVAEKTYVDPVVALRESGLPVTPERLAVERTYEIFGEVLKKENSAQAIKEKINAVHGDIIDDAQAQNLFDNRKIITTVEIGDILSKGVQDGKANQYTVMINAEFDKFFGPSGDFQSNPVSSLFRGIPVVGVGKKEFKPKEILTEDKGIIEPDIKEPQLETKKQGADVTKLERSYGYELTPKDKEKQKIIKTKGKEAIENKKRSEDDIYKQVYSIGKDEISKIEENPGKDRRLYLRRISSTLHNIDISFNRKSFPNIMDKEYLAIKKNAIDDLNAKVLDGVETKFPIKEEIRFKSGGKASTDQDVLNKEIDKIRSENERLLGVFKEKVKGEEQPKLTDEDIKGLSKEEVDALMNYRILGKEEHNIREENLSPKERVKNLKDYYEMRNFLKGMKKNENKIDAKKRADELYMVASKPAVERMEDVIKTYPKNSPQYGFNKALMEDLKHIFGWKWKGTLDSYFGMSTVKGKNLYSDYNLYKVLNKQGHFISQPKDVLKRFSEIGKPYDQLTDKDKEYIYGKRAAEASKKSEERSSEQKSSEGKHKPNEEDIKIKDALEQGFRIQGEEQGAQLNATDLTKFDEMSFGRLGGEIGLSYTAIEAARDARNLAIKIMTIHNKNTEWSNEKYKQNKPLAKYDKNGKTFNKIEEGIKMESEKAGKYIAVQNKESKPTQNEQDAAKRKRILENISGAVGKMGEKK